MNRYRIVTVTDNHDGHEEHVSPVIVTLDEAISFLDVEQMLAERTGWKLEQRRRETLVCSRKGIRRELWIRESTPFADEVA